MIMSNSFIKLNLQGVKSSKGFIVQFTGKNEMQYKEDDHILSIFVEGGVDNNRGYFELIYMSLIKTWLPPYDNEEIQKEKKEEIVQNVKEALVFLDVPYRIR